MFLTVIDIEIQIITKNLRQKKLEKITILFTPAHINCGGKNCKKNTCETFNFVEHVEFFKDFSI